MSIYAQALAATGNLCQVERWVTSKETRSQETCVKLRGGSPRDCAVMGSQEGKSRDAVCLYKRDKPKN